MIPLRSYKIKISLRNYMMRWNDKTSDNILKFNFLIFEIKKKVSRVLMPLSHWPSCTQYVTMLCSVICLFYLVGRSCKCHFGVWNGTQGLTHAKYEQVTTDWALPQPLTSFKPETLWIHMKVIISSFYIHNQSISAGIPLKLNQVIRGQC